VHRDEEAELGHRTFITYSRAMATWGETGGADESDGVLLLASGSWIPVVGNVAFRTDGDDSEAAGVDMIDRADAFFLARKRGYSIKVRDSGRDDDLRAACAARGLEAFGEPAPEMVCRHRLDDPQPADGVTLDPVNDLAALGDFIAVNAEAYSTYGMPEDVIGEVFSRPEPFLADPSALAVVARLEGRPVAASLVYLSDGVASLQWVGTVSDARHLHLGRAVTQWTTNAAFDRGAAICTLQASVMGAPLYLKLGYETLYSYTEWVRWRVTPG
jgi:hypothetical protein